MFEVIQIDQNERMWKGAIEERIWLLSRDMSK